MKYRLMFTLVFVLGSGLTTTCLAQTETLDALTRSSHIIFVGRVMKLRAANVETLSAGQDMAIVRVEEVLDAPAGIAALKGLEVTVQLLRPEGVKAEQQAVFFTNGVLFGQHLAVKEVGELAAPADRAPLKAQIAAVRARMADEALQARITNSVLVIVGKVLSVKEPERIGGISEHQPDWAVAVVQIEGIEKGSFDGKTVNVYFPQSTDERWLLSPKFRVGEQGVWLLHREGNYGLPEGALTALTPLDFQPMAERDKVRRLAK